MAADTVAERRPTAEAAPRTRLRIHHGELTSAGSALALLVVMFATKWYGVAGVPDPSAVRPATSTAINGWDGLTDVRWLMLASICAALGSVVLHASQRTHGTKTDTSRVLAVLGVTTSVALAYRVLVAFPTPARVTDQKLGAVLGLACALGIAFGARLSMLEQRSRPRGAGHRPRRRIAVPRRRSEGAAR